MSWISAEALTNSSFDKDVSAEALTDSSVETYLKSSWIDWWVHYFCF